jgi:hypothetical protein
VSSTSAVLARPRLQWSAHLWTTQRGDVGKHFQVQQVSGCARDQKTLFSRTINALCKSWRTCIERNWVYVKMIKLWAIFA